MGNAISSVFGWVFGRETKVDVLPVDLGPDADIPDPNSSLTPRQVAYITGTWNLVRPNMKAHGIKFFILFFETHPEIQQKFKPFAGKKIEDLIDSKRLAAHATTVMTALDSYITNLDDLTTVIEMLKTTGTNHRTRGVTIEDFEKLNPVFVKYLGEGLGSAWSNEAAEAWRQLLKMVVSVIGSTLAG